ncbi:MAG: autotransporter-associated beta strand repeat-containing protein, partial [Akkermansia sp.]|nr:autotransporter-associated beta strand repeat-containing protein [Akkermansia sp.]
ELDLSAITFGTDATNAIALKSNAVFTFSDTLDNDGGLVFDLGSLTEGVTYQIFDLNADNTTLNGWNDDTLDLGNFRINGTLLSEMENAGITLGEDGTFSYTLANENNPDVLYWVGGETGTWNTADAVWDITPDDMEDENTAFSTDAHVAFNTSAAVDIAGSVQAASVAVEGEDTTLSLKSGSLTVADMYLEGTLDMASGVTLTVNNTEEVSISGITGSGTLVKAGSSTLELGDAELVKLSLQSGATNVTGEVTLSGQISVGAATLNIESGAVVTANQLTGGNEGNNHPSSININGGELYITGSTNHAMNNDACTSNSILLAHWKSSNTVLTLNSGKLVAEDAVLNTSRDSKGTFKALGGEATLLGIDLMGHNDQNRDGQFDLGTATTGSAVVTLGSRGIKNVSRGAVVNLGEGTLKSSADFSIDGNNSVSLIGTVNGTIFDTNAHNITVNTVLTGGGKLVKNGAGDLKLTTANTYTGGSTINNGSLTITHAQALGGGGGVLGKLNGTGTLVIDMADANTRVFATGSGD